MNTFEPLFRENHFWKIWLESVKDGILIKTEYGTIGGKTIANEKKIIEGKAKRTIIEQANLEALSKWRTKHDKNGYSTKLELSKSKKIDIIQPMLANKFIPNKTKLSFPVNIQRKYDGIRCLYMNDKLYTRQRKEINNFKNIKMELHELKIPKNIYLDGELYTQELPFEELSGLVRLDPGKIDPDKESKINYLIYDAIVLDAPKMSFTCRFKLLQELIPDSMKNIRLVQTLTASNYEQIDKLHDEFVEEGYEGLMIRIPDSEYVIRKRSNNLLKYKKFQDEEFKIIGFHEGTGTDKGTVIWDLETKQKKQFSARPMGSYEFRALLLKDANKYIGKKLTVKFFEYTADGVPRFPVGKAIRDKT